MATIEDVKKIKAQVDKFTKVLEQYEKAFKKAGGASEEEEAKMQHLRDALEQAQSRIHEVAPDLSDEDYNPGVSDGTVEEGNDSPNPNIEKDDKGKAVYKDVTKAKLGQIIDVFKKGGTDKTEVHWNDVKQGQLGDCYFLSAIGAVAKANPAILKNLIKGPDKNGDYEVTMYIDGSYFSSRKPKKVKVTAEFLLKPDGSPLYAGSGDKEMWVMLLEKAYTILRKDEKYWDSRVSKLDDGYNKLKGGWGEEGIEVLTGKEATTYWIKDLSSDKINTMVSSALKDKRPITTGTIDKPKDGIAPNATQKAAMALNLKLAHEYFVLSFDGKNIKLQNPWNSPGAGNSDITISFSDYKKYFRNICVQDK